MVVFDESKVINALHTDRAELGKKYWFADDIYNLKICIEHEDEHCINELESVCKDGAYPFRGDDNLNYRLLYPYEESSKQRMTNRQLAEWLARGNGQYMLVGRIPPMTYFQYDYDDEDDEVDGGYNFVIRPFGSDEWIPPTTDIYERDCK